MTEHSPTPWTLDFTNTIEQVCRVRDAEGNAIADVYETDIDPLVSEKMAKANARLVQASPALLAALIEARKWIGDGEDADPIDRSCWTPAYTALVDMVDAAIASAEGVAS